MFITNLLELEAKYAKLLNEVEYYLYNSPSEHLRISRRGTFTSFFICQKGDANGEYVSKNDPKTQEKIKILAQKRYCKEMLPVVQQDLDAIQCAMKKVHPETLADVFNNLPNEFKELVNPYELPDEDYAERWENITYKRSTFEFEENKYTTKKGDKVRSKSELIIANLLYDKGIPYKYEKVYKIPKYGEFAPDFTVLNKKTRQVYIWEHFGLLGREKYRINMINKIKMYTEYEVQTGIKFLTTFEDEGTGIDLNHLDNVIHNNFL